MNYTKEKLIEILYALDIGEENCFFKNKPQPLEKRAISLVVRKYRIEGISLSKSTVDRSLV